MQKQDRSAPTPHDRVVHRNGVWVILNPTSGYCHGPYPTKKIAEETLAAGQKGGK